MLRGILIKRPLRVGNERELRFGENKTHKKRKYVYEK